MPIIGATQLEPVNILGSYVQGLEGARANRMARAQEAAMLREMEEKTALRNMLMGATEKDLQDPSFLNRLAITPGGAATAQSLAQSMASQRAARKSDLEATRLEVERLAGEAGSFLQAYKDDPSSLNKAAVAPWLTSAVRRGLMNPEDLQTFDAMPDDPKLLARRLQQLQAQGMSIADQIRYTTPTAGEELAAATTRRGQDISAATAREGQQVTRRGQDISAETARRGQDINARLQSPEHQAAITTARQRAISDVKFVDEFQAADQTARRTLSLLDSIIGDAQIVDGKLAVQEGKRKPMKGFAAAVGAGIPGERFVPATAARDFNAAHDQAVGAAFLQAFETLKGGGQITVTEGEKATAALTRMNLAQSEVEYIRAAREFQREVKNVLNLAETRYRKLNPSYTGAPTPGAETPSVEDLLKKYE